MTAPFMIRPVTAPFCQKLCSSLGYPDCQLNEPAGGL